MKCISERTIPATEGRRGMTVSCGMCGACLYNRRVAWTFRIAEETRAHLSTYFVTLTYAPEFLPYGNYGMPSLCKSDLQKFIKRLRKWLKKLGLPNIRYYSLGEYGSETFRPHYHIIIFGLNRIGAQIIQEVWGMGHVTVDSVNPQRIHYITKYHVNKYDPEQVHHNVREGSFTTMSLKPFIGHNYLKRMGKWHREHEDSCADINGFKVPLPRIFKENIWPDEETRERISLQNNESMIEGYWKEYHRLEELGIDEPEYYMRASNYIAAEKVKKQAKRGLDL